MNPAVRYGRNAIANLHNSALSFDTFEKQSALHSGVEHNVKKLSDTMTRKAEKTTGK